MELHGRVAIVTGAAQGIGLYVTGLILLERGQTAVRITTVLPGRAHDALNRLLRVSGLAV
jgi:NAD(P)-dependent dehydrogenase (short-subunit alcohol dehydrogenase family)